MGIMRLVIAVLAMVGGVVAAAPAPEQSRAVEVWVTAAVEIDASGHVQELEWDENSKLDTLLAKRLTPTVQAWEFEAATVDGRPQLTQTGLAVHVRVEELTDQSLAMRLLDARTGPTALALSPPAYPRGAMGRGVSARVEVVLDVQADGSPVVRDMAYESDESGHSGRHLSGSRNEFLASATRAIKTWKFRPEIVAGRLVPGPGLNIPISYCLDPSPWCARNRDAWNAKRKLPANLHMGDSSAVALKTDISAQVI